MSERRLVVLARSDTYEGFERPGLAHAHARELEAANDIPGLRKVLTQLAREGDDGYDLVAVGGWPGSAWELLGADILDQDGRSAIVHDMRPEFQDTLNEHGLFSHPKEARAFLEASGAAEVLPVQRLRRSAIDPHNVLWFTMGNEHNPSDPFGRVVLTADDENRLALEHHSRTGDAAYTADLGPGVLDEIRAALHRGGFPDVPRRPIPAGATMRELELVTDGEPQYAMVEDFLGKELEGYRDAFAILDSITLQLTGHAEHDTLKTPVSNVRKLA
jgi:hypothetical protein